VAFAAALLLAAELAWWTWATDTGRIGNVRVLQQPDGAEVVLSLQRVMSVVDERHYVVGNATLRVPVEGPTAGLSPGVEVTVGAVVRDGYVEERWRELATGRGAKKRLGFAGLGLAAVVALLTLRVERGGVAVRG
jgi:hypothetical protein